MFFGTASIIALIEHYGYTIIFPISIVEGPVVTLISGFLVSLGLLNAFGVFCVLVAGDLVGDTLYYFIGRWGREGFVRRWGKYFGLTPERVAHVREYFHTRGWKLLLLSKAHGAGSLVLFSAGAAEMPYPKFLFYNFVGTVPRVFILETIGIYGGASFALINQYVNGVAAVLSVVFILAVAWWFYKRSGGESSGRGGGLTS
ncbi:MAG: DedA family protein [Candidatus Paceibacterota bacterium]|jgi:membrane protein DedA with SNARE-associated domain